MPDPEPVFVRNAMPWVLRELDPAHEPGAADLSHVVKGCDEVVEELAEQLDLRLEALQGPLLLEHVERGEGGGAGERVAGVGVAVEEAAELVVVAEKALVDTIGGERRCQREVATAQSLREAEEVRNHVVL